ncbi:MAG: hypothetical protein NTX05_09000 [Fusobacteria bacterium]|nr:hypothetical protein [Fusobacteriota bacterium]
MKKIILLTIITAGTALSTTAFAGQGFNVTIHNNLLYPIQYKSISQDNWYHNDIPWSWKTLGAKSSSSVLYTEYDASAGCWATGGDQITVGIESTTGTKIGFFEITDSPNISNGIDSIGWENINTAWQYFRPDACGWFIGIGSVSHDPTISATTLNTSDPNIVDVNIG